MTLSLRAVSILLLFCVSGCASKAPVGWTAFGDDIVIEEQSTPIASLQGGERDVVIAGTITDVCKIKGCWMNVKDNAGSEIFVQFENYGFFVPMNSTGHRVKVHGRAVKMEWSVEELRHFAEDAHKSPAEIAAINQPKTRVTFMADAAWVEGPGLDNPHSQ